MNILDFLKQKEDYSAILFKPRNARNPVLFACECGTINPVAIQEMRNGYHQLSETQKCCGCQTLSMAHY